jgi:parallel beta-helix repeat protein
VAAVGVLAMPAEPASAAPTDGTFVDPVALLPGAGSIGPGSVSYPIPTGNVLFVAPNGNDAAAGTQSAPLRTIQAAADRAISGTTIVLRGGVYHQSAWVKRGPVTIQNYGNEAVWLDGSTPTTGWVRDGTAARWVVNFTSALTVPTNVDALAIDPAYPLAADPHMIFVNGTPLTQVSSRTAATAGKFFHDKPNKKLYIGTDPASGEVRVTNLDTALAVQVAGTTVRGIGVRRYGTLLHDQGALRFTTDFGKVEQVTLHQNAIAGLSIMGRDAVVRNVTSYENGRLGIHGDYAHRVFVEDSAVFRNNTERFSIEGAAGGLKLTHSNQARVTGMAAYDNFGKGIWFDLASANSKTVRSVSARNDAGVMVEMSGGGIVASNVIADNNDGIRILETSNTHIYNNTLWNNGRGISFIDGERTKTATNSTIKNNALCASTASVNPHLVVDDVNDKRSGWVMGAVSNNNAYYRRSTDTTPYKMVWGNHPNGRIVSRTLSAIQSGTGQDLASVAAENATSCPFYGDYMTNPLTVMGAALPSNVANAVGVKAGVPTRIGIIALA